MRQPHRVARATPARRAVCVSVARVGFAATGVGSWTMSAAATVTRSQLPMRSSSASAIDARHVQQGRAGNLTYATLLSTKVDPTAVYGVLGLHRSLRRVQSMYPLLCLLSEVAQQGSGPGENPGGSPDSMTA